MTSLYRLQTIAKMDKEVAETLAYFRQHASDLRNLGKNWGLTEEEIEECIERAMSVDPKDLPPPESGAASTTRLKFAARKTWPKLRILLWIVGITIVLIGLGALAMQNEEIDHRVSQIIQPVLYPLFRYVRLAAVSLHDSINFYDAYLEDCIVSNPLYDRESVLGDHACENCASATTVTQFTEASLEQGPPPGPTFIEPLLFKRKGRNVSLETFQSILFNNPFAQHPMQGVKTNLTWASQVKDLLDKDVAEKLAAQPDFFFFWVSKLVWTSQIMRKVFPKPSILGSAEVAIRKSIFITGPEADGFELPQNPFPHNWYMQGTGSRKLVLTPVAMCQKECSSVSVVLNAGDMITYNNNIYEADIQPAGGDISIAFLGHFNPE